MITKWNKRCDHNHVGHFFMDYMRKRDNVICQLKRFFNIVKPKLAFCEYAMLEDYKNAVRALGLGTEIVTFDGGENSLAKFMDANRDLQPENEFQVATFNTDEVYCWLVSTSGSTGQPKLVALTHQHILHMIDFYKYHDAENGMRKTALNISNLQWISGCYNALMMPLNHIKLQTSAPVTAEHVIDVINKYKIDAATGEAETCNSVLSRSIQLAQCFGKLGLAPGDPVVVGGRNHLDVHIPFYAGMMSGMPVAGVDPTLKYIELKRFFNIVKPKLAFCEYAMLEDYKNAVRALGLGTEIVTFGGGENSLAKFMDANRDLQPEDEFQVATFNTDEVYCWLVSTSGSTGQPKLVALTHQHILHMIDFYKYHDAENGMRKTALNISNLQWISGCYNALMMPLNHIKLQTSAPVTAEHVIDVINKYKPAGTLCTPTILATILSHEKHCDLTCFDVIKTGGCKVHSELLIDLRNRVRSDTIICQGYGSSETGGAVLTSFSESSPYGNIGTVDPKYEAKLISPESGKEILEPYVTGELLVRGPTMACYYNDPKETEMVFTDDGYLKTGDLFYKDENENYFFIERLKMVLKYKNYQIAPPEVEEVILRHAGVADACVTGVPHAQNGEHVVACVVRKPGVQVTAQDIKALVAKHLSASKHLHGGVVFLDALPTTATGKVARLQVKKLVLTAERE